MQRTLGTATYWANQAGIADKVVRAALDGIPPDGTRGNSQRAYFLATVWRALQGPTADGELDAEQQRARRDKEQADHLALRNATTRGELAPVEELDAIWSQHIAAARARLLSMPSKLAPQLAGQDAAQIATAIKTEVHAALAELSEYTPEGAA